MSPVAVALLIAAVVLVVATEWSHLSSRAGTSRPRARRPAEAARLGGRQRPWKRKQSTPHLQVVHPDSEEFARAVERDLAALPTIDERDAKRR